MPSRWFRVPAETKSDAGGYEQPKYADFGRAFKTGFEHPNGSPIFVARIAADSGTLDTIAGKSDSTELSETQVEDALNGVWDASRSYSEWDEAFDLSEYE